MAELVMPTKIAFFDFDGTLVDFDTVNPFIRFVLSRHPEKDVEPDRRLPHKQYRLKLLYGLERDNLDVIAESFYKKKIRPHLIPQTISRMRGLKKQGYTICIVSGSYDAYLTHFCREFEIDELFCTRIKYSDNICMGVFDGFDCLAENKLNALRLRFGSADFTQCDSIAYSDSVTDLPLFHSCKKKAIVVDTNEHIQKWMKELGGEIIVYNIRPTRVLQKKLDWFWRKLTRVSD